MPPWNQTAAARRRASNGSLDVETRDRSPVRMAGSARSAAAFAEAPAASPPPDEVVSEPARHRGSLPHRLSARSFAIAWAIAIGAHLLLLAVALSWHRATPVAEEPPIRLVFREPPPPPPAPLGAPDGGGAAPAAPQDGARASSREPAHDDARLVHQTKAPPTAARPKPKPEAKKPVPPASVAPARAEQNEVAARDVAPGTAAGSANGEAAGVAGGVAGGVPGGVVGGRGAVPVSQVAEPPVLVRRVPPVYPEEARRRDVEGLVLLEAVLDRDGRVEPDVKVLRSIPLLDAEAIAAVRQWRFSPARARGGETVRVILEVPIRFVLR